MHSEVDVQKATLPLDDITNMHKETIITGSRQRSYFPLQVTLQDNEFVLIAVIL